MFRGYVPMVPLTRRGMLFDWSYKVKEKEWGLWGGQLPAFSLVSRKDDDDDDDKDDRPKTIKFHSLLVPTVDTTQ
jgi:hypothetical protein